MQRDNYFPGGFARGYFSSGYFPLVVSPLIPPGLNLGVGGPPPHYQERQEQKYEMSDIEDTMESVDMIMAWLAQQ